MKKHQEGKIREPQGYKASTENVSMYADQEELKSDVSMHKLKIDVKSANYQSFLGDQDAKMSSYSNYSIPFGKPKQP